jgi:hypothetical protein
LAYERTLIQIRERGFLDLLDLALVVVRSRPATLGLAAAAGIAPFAALNAWLTSDPEFPPVLLFPLILMEAPWATAPLTVVLGRLMFGMRPSAGRVLATLGRSLPAMLLFQGLVRGLLMMTGVLYALVPARLAFANEVILLERQRWPVVGRCGQLSDDRGGEFFARWLAQLAFGGLFVVAFWLGTGSLSHALIGRELTWDEPGWGDLYGARAQGAVWLAVAFFAVARFLMYIDQRIRLEGWEVELRLTDVGRALEESRPW